MGQNHPKKLVLNRETVRDLNKDELQGVDGGKGVGNTNHCPTAVTTVDSGPPWPCPICCI